MSAPICDFCNGGAATHALRGDDLAAIARGTYGTVVAALSGAWHSCDACLPYVERGDTDGLADFVTRAAHGPPELLRLTSAEFRRDVFRQLYKRVLPQLGAPQPLGREAVGAGGALPSEPGAKP